METTKTSVGKWPATKGVTVATSLQPGASSLSMENCDPGRHFDEGNELWIAIIDLLKTKALRPDLWTSKKSQCLGCQNPIEVPVHVLAPSRSIQLSANDQEKQSKRTKCLGRDSHVGDPHAAPDLHLGQNWPLQASEDWTNRWKICICVCLHNSSK